MVAVAMMFTASLGAQAQSPFPITPKLIDSLNSKDATWPKDPAVPDLPPLSATDDPPVPEDNFLRSHYWDGLHPPKKKAPTPLTASVTTANPLKIDVIWSMRSPYCYIMLQRLKWLQSNYNVDLTVRYVLPIAVRSTKGGSGKAGGVFGLWYKVQDEVWDVVRTAQFEGVPFKWATPDPIWQTFHPPFGKNYLMVHPPAKQPYIGWVTRLGAYAQMKGKSLEYAAQVSHIIWSNDFEHWPANVKELFNHIVGLDYDEAIE
jgi:hypothetical protein